MSAPAPVNDLAGRKRLLIAQAELHRQIILIERFRVQQRLDLARDRLQANRWWLMGGVALAGWLTTRRFGSLLKLVPAGMGVWRLLQKYLAR